LSYPPHSTLFPYTTLFRSLHAPESTPVARVSVLDWIGNAAAQLLGRHGAVSDQANQVACSRQTVYDHAAKVEAAVRAAQRPGPSDRKSTRLNSSHVAISYA